MDAEKWLDVHIHDYLLKRGLKVSAEGFKSEARVIPDFNAIDSPAGFLFDLWSVFWDASNRRTTEVDTDAASSCIEMMLMRAVEQQYQLLQQVQRPPQQWQQQQLEGGHVLISPVPAPAPATRKYDDRLKLSKQRDPLDDASMMTVQVHGTSSGSTVIGDASVSSSSRGNDQIGIKRKQPVSYSGTVKTTSFPSVSPSMPALPQSASSSVPHLSRDEADSQDIAARNPVSKEALRLREVSSIDTSNSSTVISCHFSTDGKLLASGDHDRKAVLWYANTMEPKATLEGHLSLVTDVRFGPNIARLATSSSDKTVKIWDVNNPGSALCTFTGHSACVTSLDWHPNKDLICSCDANGEIRYWSISGGGCVAIFMVCDAVQVRFQPLVGRFLAAATPNAVLILDAETQTCCHSLEGHKEPIHTICWDHSGEVLACVSEISVRVWTLRGGNEWTCLAEHMFAFNKFQSCVFHPRHPSALVLGCYQSLEVWDITDNITTHIPARQGLIAALDSSTVAGLVASASHEKIIKLWK